MANTIPTQQETVHARPIWTPPPPVKPGPEMEALKRFHYDCEWDGTVQAGGMGPGSPEMKATGKATFRHIMDGTWLVGEFEQEQFVGGALAIKWKAHYVVGWSPHAAAYRVTYVDNNGTASLMDGSCRGPPVRYRNQW